MIKKIMAFWVLLRIAGKTKHSATHDGQYAAEVVNTMFKKLEEMKQTQE